eukprot:CAMPEP_0179488474 /NCGR_PEP_ID=MMETSP0799-20121207/64107_1 /TAXON_ID=46947 /ORGANISM="Geminigera cryophila, Strain CCMP2564" /LENGTH=54 /DNA_ID=CAMNT_0021303927 /DNA_START=644 /DNA_END=805 /DNA_ORIENTATION=-
MPARPAVGPDRLQMPLAGGRRAAGLAAGSIEATAAPSSGRELGMERRIVASKSL